jgi:hypothetical protein
MDWRDFVASLVDSLAWPVAVVVLVVVLRKHIANVFDGTLHRLKLGPAGAELEWARAEADTATAATAAVKRSREVGSDDGGDGGPRSLLEERFAELEHLADLNPVEAVDGTYGLVRMILRNLLVERGVERPPDDWSMDPLIKAAFMGKVITKETGQALRGLVVLRNLTMSDPSADRATPEKAHDYIVLARSVLYALGVDAVDLTAA